MSYTTEQLLAEARRTFPFTELWRILRLPHQPRINFVMPCPYRQLATEMDFLPLDPFHWRDLRTGETGDAFALLCRLRGEDPKKADDHTIMQFLDTTIEFLSIAELAPLLQNVKKAEKPPLEPPTPLIDNQLTTPLQQQSHQTRLQQKKTAADLLALIPIDQPILQADLFSAARVAHINNNYARAFLSELLELKQIITNKIPRQGTKSALAYCRLAPIGNLSKLSSPPETR
jgi:hypothetical protein